MGYLLQTLVDLSLTDTGTIWSTAPWFVPIHRLRAQKGALSEAFGRSRGGFVSKVYALCDNQGRPLGVVLTGDQVSDYKATDALMKLPVQPPKPLMAS
ncbi:hypothetical protein [Gluconobacter cerinus]|uniref:hypothetical protein n=1 Tax=Gluconobacter cerinus TaxID=38307 RepID=UPI00201243D8|nr:hypothetical protein [Gluconobacter cerinus]